MIAFFGNGLIGGMFGVGAGWANVPTLNLLMGAPLKVAVGTSSAILSMASSSAIWTYMNAGAVLPIVAAPAMIGVMLGARVGARLLAVLHGAVIRRLVIALLLFAGLRSLLKGHGRMELKPRTPQAAADRCPRGPAALRAASCAGAPGPGRSCSPRRSAPMSSGCCPRASQLASLPALWTLSAPDYLATHGRQCRLELDHAASPAARMRASSGSPSWPAARWRASPPRFPPTCGGATRATR